MSFEVMDQLQSIPRNQNLDIIRQIVAGRSIVLVGLMGCGKSTIGRKLAKSLNVAFFDSDDEIEKAAGMSITEIFAQYGEPEFRRGEKQVLARLLDGPPAIIATGGGAFMDPDTRATIKEKAHSVWLKASLDTLMRRVSKKPTRPLLQKENPRDIMQSLIDARYPVYAEADVTCVTGNNSRERVMQDVMKALITHVDAV